MNDDTNPEDAMGPFGSLGGILRDILKNAGVEMKSFNSPEALIEELKKKENDKYEVVGPMTEKEIKLYNEAKTDMEQSKSLRDRAEGKIRLLRSVVESERGLWGEVIKIDEDMQHILKLKKKPE